MQGAGGGGKTVPTRVPLSPADFAGVDLIWRRGTEGEILEPGAPAARTVGPGLAGGVTGVDFAFRSGLIY